MLNIQVSLRVQNRQKVSQYILNIEYSDYEPYLHTEVLAHLMYVRGDQVLIAEGFCWIALARLPGVDEMSDQMKV